MEQLKHIVIITIKNHLNFIFYIKEKGVMRITEKTINFPIVFHFHQPVDNFGHVIEDCYQKSYGPLIDTIFKHPEVKVTLHFSGNLLEWFIEHKPELIDKIKKMAQRGQIEIIGGGYYEPIFAIIPNRDKIAQMRKLSNLIKTEFGLEVKGAWLSERVWEPTYPSFLSEVGLEYVIVDDNHFRSCGITQEGTLYSYITEDEGKTLRIFPINEPIRYLTPWKPTYLTVDYLKSVANEKGDRIALLISDAEKMGVWGTTHLFCYVEGKGHEDGDNGKPFVTAFFEQIEKNQWIKSLTLSEYMDKYPAKDLVYLPTASYDKMEEWVLPTEIRKNFKRVRKELKDDPEQEEIYQFLKGGFWRYFLVKYPESNNMHKKMLHVREKLLKIEEKIRQLKDSSLISKIKPKVLKTWDEIYKAQCNDCYWHGMFGGVYLQFLRFSVYTHLINAEKLIDEMNGIELSRGSSYISIEPLDFNKDSKLDVLIESEILNVYFNPSEGGTIFELDYKPKSYNLLNTLTRWPEAYHESDKIEQSELMVDRYRRSMLRLRLLHDDVTFEQLQSDEYYEFGDFVNGNFKVSRSEIDGKRATLEMEMIGGIKDTESDEKIQCTITKQIVVVDDEIEIFVNGTLAEGSRDEDVLRRILAKLYVAIDLPFFFNGDSRTFQWETEDSISETMTKKTLMEPFQYKGSNFKAYDETYDLTLDIDIDSNSEWQQINHFPIIAYAYTDVGYKKIYQGLNVTPCFKLDKNFEIKVKLKIS